MKRMTAGEMVAGWGLAALWVLGGWGMSVWPWLRGVSVGGVGLVIWLGILVLVWREKGGLEWPKGVGWWLVWMGWWAGSLAWTPEQEIALRHFWMFAAGGVGWVAAYNLGSKWRRVWEISLVVAGVLFLELALTAKWLGVGQVSPTSLFLQSNSYFNHNHLGDFWAIVVVMLAVKFIAGRKYAEWVGIVVGLGAMIISGSRSAYLAAAAGLGYVMKGKNRRWFWLAMGALAVLFVASGARKSTLFSRPYFVQGIVGMVRRPLGWGMGSFKEVSSDPQNWFLGMKDFSTMAHNLIIEVGAGTGIVGVAFFVMWLLTVAGGLGKEGVEVQYWAVWLAILVNFMFDYTYFVPTMMWVWMTALGLAQARGEGGKILAKESYGRGSNKTGSKKNGG